jgi:hypothetical protein
MGYIDYPVDDVTHDDLIFSTIHIFFGVPFPETKETGEKFH